MCFLWNPIWFERYEAVRATILPWQVKESNKWIKESNWKGPDSLELSQCRYRVYGVESDLYTFADGLLVCIQLFIFIFLWGELGCSKIISRFHVELLKMWPSHPKCIVCISINWWLNTIFLLFYLWSTSGSILGNWSILSPFTLQGSQTIEEFKSQRKNPTSQIEFYRERLGPNEIEPKFHEPQPNLTPNVMIILVIN